MAKPTRRRRIQRVEDDLLLALRTHVDLLRHYITQAFNGADHRYLGEIAGKLRLLAARTATNRPLLLTLMEKRGFNPVLTMDSPWQEKMTLSEYMDSLALAIRVDGELAQFTNREFVLAWAQQDGSAHEDEAHDAGYAASRATPVFIGGLHAHAAVLRSIAITVLAVGEAFLAKFGETPGPSEPNPPVQPIGSAGG